MATIRGFTPKQQTNDFVRRMTELGSKRIPRAIQYALNGVAIEAAKRAPAMLGKELETPTPWSMRAFFAEKGKLSEANGKRLDQLSSAIRVKDQQSPIFKYLLGDRGSVTRRPGDVGMARKSILLPVWANLAAIGIKPNSKGNLPKGALDSVFANAANGAFWGRPRILGRQRPDGLWARPERAWVDAKGNRWVGRNSSGKLDKSIRPARGEAKRANMGVPKLLFVAVPHTRHLTILQRPVEKLAGRAMSTMGEKLTKELASEVGRMGGLASVAARRAQRRDRER